MSTPSKNPDRVTNPVLVRSILLAVVGLLAAFGIDLNLSRDQAGALSDGIVAVLPVLTTLAGLIWGARKARANVTPIRTDLGDQPQALDGTPLAPAGHGPDQGYPRTDEEQAERLQRRPRVDKRGIDRDPGGF